MPSPVTARRPKLELLEDRTAPAVLTVTTAVDSTNPAGEPGSLRAVLKLAADGDVITFAPALAGQMIQLAVEDLPVTHSVTIRGPGAGRLTVQGRQGLATGVSAGVFEVAAGVRATIQGLTIRGGQSGSGGGILNAGTLTLVDSVVKDNLVYTASVAAGGGIANSGTLTLVRTVVSGNAARAIPVKATYGTKLAEGSGVYSSGTLTLVDSRVEGNTAAAQTLAATATAEGGGVFSTGAFLALRSDVNDNLASAQSGAIATAVAQGGGVFIGGGLAVLVTSSINPSRPPRRPAAACSSPARAQPPGCGSRSSPTTVLLPPK